MNRLKSWMAPALATVILAIFVISSAIFYHQVQDELRTKETSLVAKAIALNLVNEIKSVTRVLNGISQIENTNPRSKLELYDKMSKELFQRYPGFFYGINFINPSGIIEKVYPEVENRAALGRNLMERPEIKPYLIESLKSRTTMMSCRVITYQGIYAVIIYEPLYDQNNQFKGWVNALINIDVWLKQQLEAEGWNDVYIQMQWDGKPTDFLEIGKNNSERVFQYEVAVLNQTIQIKVGLGKSALSSLHNRLLIMLEILGVFLLVLVSYLLFRLTISAQKLIVVNRQLNLKNILLNSLAHDISNPLSSLGLVIEQMLIKSENAVAGSLKNRAEKCMNILNEMMSSVRSLGRLEMEKEEFKTTAVSIKRAAAAAIDSVLEQAERKRVIIKNEINSEDIFVEADNATLINNVLPNVLNNSIKFTGTDTTVTVSFQESGTFVFILIADQGSGFTEAEINNFNAGHNLSTSLGTEGEVGSGLGLTQVKGFMELYGGRALLDNSGQGALIKLKFRKALQPA